MRDSEPTVLSRNEVFLQRLKEIISQNLENEQFGVEELASEVGYSRSQLHRKVKLIVGKPVSQFIREIRLEEALKLILKDAGTIAEIAYSVGFSSPSYFNRCFHKQYNYAPNELVERIRSKKIKVEDLLTDYAPTRRKHGIFQRYWYIPLTLITIAAVLLFVNQNARESATPTSDLSLAVLPLDNISNNEESVYITEGMHDAIIGALGKLHSIRVVSRTSTLKFDANPPSIQEAAEKLDVQLVLEGSVFYQGDSARIQLQLIEAYPKETHLWANEYLIGIEDALLLCSQLAQDIAAEINVSIPPQDKKRLTASNTLNADTYRAYLKGMHFVNKSTPADFEKGMGYLQQAIDQNPADPMAYVGLAQGYIQLGHGPDPEIRYWQRAKAAAEIAINLDSTQAEAYAVLGMVNMYYTFDWKASERMFIKANSMNNNLALSHFHYAWLLAIMGRYEEAIREHTLAKQLDPLTPIFTVDMGSLYYWVGDYDRAIREIKQGLELDPEFHHGWWILGTVYAHLGRYEDAIQAHQKAVAINPAWKWALATTYAKAGKETQARQILNELKNDQISSRTAIGLFFIHHALGQWDEAFAWLAFEPRDTWTGTLRTWPGLEELRADVRFNRFLSDVNLPPVSPPM